jgi:hypothetical protein
MKGEKQKVHVTWKEKNWEKCLSHDFATYKFFTRKNFKSQVEVKSNLSDKLKSWPNSKSQFDSSRQFIFNASKLFNSKHYPYDNDDMSLDKLLMKFTILKVKNLLCKVELLEFVETLRCECDNKWWNLAPHILTKATPPPAPSPQKEKQGTKWTDPHPRRQINEPPKKVNHKGKENQVLEPLQWR